jgi:hypothetical protein
MKTSARNANLHAILADDEGVCQTVTEMVTTLHPIEKEDIRGFSRANLLDPTMPANIVEANGKPIHLDFQVHQLLCKLLDHSSPGLHHPLTIHALSVDEISIHGVSYGTWESPKFRNSAIMFQPFDALPNGMQKAGIIQTIFQYTHSSVSGMQMKGFYLSVLEHLPVDSHSDPFRKFGFAGGFLCAGQASRLHVIEQSEVISHFALTKIMGHEDEQLIHVLPVDRVSVL